MRQLVVAAVLSLTASTGWAAPRPQSLVISTEQLSQRLDERDLVILQVGDSAGYAAGHIPGAQLVSLAELAAPASPEALNLQMPDPEALRLKLQALGVTPRSRIVVAPTKDGIQMATRVVFTLDAAGLGGRTALLQGGAAAWAAEGRPVSTRMPAVKPGSLPPIRYRPLVVDADFVRRHLSAPGYAIVDARTPEFFSGARTGGQSARPHKTGHIAGAKSVPYTSVTTPDLRLKPSEEIVAQMQAAGVKRGDTVIAYCHIGQQASATLLAARAAGYDVRLYDGSFEEWSRLDGPVETSK